MFLCIQICFLALISILLLRSSKPDSCISDILKTVVPSKSYLAARGGAFNEYISTLSQIQDSRIPVYLITLASEGKEESLLLGSRGFLFRYSRFCKSESSCILLQRTESRDSEVQEQD